MFAYYIIIVIVVVISCLDNSYFISASSSIEVNVNGNIVTDDDDDEKPTPSATKQSNIFSGIFEDGAPSILSTASVKNIDNLIKNIAKRQSTVLRTMVMMRTPRRTMYYIIR